MANLKLISAKKKRKKRESGRNKRVVRDSEDTRGEMNIRMGSSLASRVLQVSCACVDFARSFNTLRKLIGHHTQSRKTPLSVPTFPQMPPTCRCHFKLPAGACNRICNVSCCTMGGESTSCCDESSFLRSKVEGEKTEGHRRWNPSITFRLCAWRMTGLVTSGKRIKCSSNKSNYNNRQPVAQLVEHWEVVSSTPAGPKLRVSAAFVITSAKWSSRIRTINRWPRLTIPSMFKISTWDVKEFTHYS